MTTKNLIKELKEKIVEIQEYIDASGCSACFDMVKKLKEYEDEIETIKVSLEKDQI